MKEKKEYLEFERLCRAVDAHFQSRMESEGNLALLTASLTAQKNAMLGHEKETTELTGEIRAYIGEKSMGAVPFPPWYPDLASGVFHENYGLAGLAEWFSSKFKESSSAKIIGERMYFLQDGRMVRMPQTISKTRREKLKKALLLQNPEMRRDKAVYEIYMPDGTRVEILTGNLVKDGEDVFVFRRYIVPRYTFREQSDRGTIPKEAAGLFESMVRLGMNVAFTGAVRTAKTTFLKTWQMSEDPALEGLLIETDPEIPLHRLMPKAPIVQLIADGQEMDEVIKAAMRADSDYIVVAEARDGYALDAAVKAACKGTRRVKLTYHTTDPREFVYDAAAEIVRCKGGELKATMVKVAKSFDYMLHFVQLEDKNQKRLHSIYEISWDGAKEMIKASCICRYDYEADDWRWDFVFSDDKNEKCEAAGKGEISNFCTILKSLAEKNPLTGQGRGKQGDTEGKT